MAQVDRIFELLSIFQTNSYALTTEKIAQRLECSIPDGQTLRRQVEEHLRHSPPLRLSISRLYP